MVSCLSYINSAEFFKLHKKRPKFCENYDVSRLGTVQKSMINFLVERFKSPFTINQFGIS